MNAKETIAAAIRKLEAIRTVPPTVWTVGPYANATTLLRRTVEPQIVILKQALGELEALPSGLRLPDDAVQRELDLANEILRERS